MSGASFTTALWALAAAGFSLLAWWRLRHRPPATAPLDAWPPVLLLRPVEAPSAAELSALASPIDYEGELEQVVVSPYRPRLGSNVGWLYSDPPSRNRKVGHLRYALSTLPTEGRYLLAIDADVRVDGHLVRALVSSLHRGAALSYAPPAPQLGGHSAAWAVSGLLTHSHHSFFALDAMSVGPKAVCGKAVGLSPSACEELVHVASVVGEDLELAKRLTGRGERVELVASPAVTVEGGSWPSVLARFTRWMQVLRAHRPSLYPTIPLLLVPTIPLLGLAVTLNQTPLWVAVAGLVLARTLLSVRLGRRLGAPVVRSMWIWLLGEGLLGGAFVGSLFQRKVRWRGREFSLDHRGVLQPLWNKEVGP